MHHIVAKSAKAAKAARDALEKAGIDINSPANLVPVSYAVHRRMHTTAYYNLVNLMMTTAIEEAGDDPTLQYAYAMIALEELRVFILSLNAVIPAP